MLSDYCLKTCTSFNFISFFTFYCSVAFWQLIIIITTMMMMMMNIMTPTAQERLIFLKNFRHGRNQRGPKDGKQGMGFWGRRHQTRSPSAMGFWDRSGLWWSPGRWKVFSHYHHSGVSCLKQALMSQQWWNIVNISSTDFTMFRHGLLIVKHVRACSVRTQY